MTDNGNDTPQKGIFQGIMRQIKLVWMLWNDNRVHPLLKLIPMGSILYWLIPFDIPGPVDDAAVIWFSATLFVELCPADIVAEYRAILDGKNGDNIVIDAEEVVEKEKTRGTSKYDRNY